MDAADDDAKGRAAGADARLVERLRAGDQAAFTRLFEEHHPMLLRLAVSFVKSASIAEDVVQDTWVAVIDSLESFEQRSTLRTWIARIAVNRAKTRAMRDGRTVPLGDGDEDHAPAVDPSRFLSWGLFRGFPDRWEETPEALVGRREAREAIEAGLAELPPGQRAVLTLRDLEDFTSDEVCEALGITPANQRVLLHRGRSRLRAVLERVLRKGAEGDDVP